MGKRFFVSGIGTDVGKTIVSAILCEAFEADYWKPVQAGDLEHSDAAKVRQWIKNDKTVFHPERYRLQHAMSPHAAAKLEDMRISPRDFTMPDTANNLIIEGAGGLMVPLNEHFLVIDLIEDLGVPVILVARNYLGSINHTLLSAELLRTRDIEVAGIIFNGSPNEETESVIESYSGLHIIGRIDEEESWTPEVISRYSKEFKSAL